MRFARGIFPLNAGMFIQIQHIYKFAVMAFMAGVASQKRKLTLPGHLVSPLIPGVHEYPLWHPIIVSAMLMMHQFFLFYIAVHLLIIQM